MVGLLLTIGGMTLVKCSPNFETPAQIHTVPIKSLPAMIMSTKGKVVKNNNAGRYCSPRAARKIVLSRSPITTSSTIGRISSAGLTRPEVLSGSAALSDALCTPGAPSATPIVAISARYTPTSNRVRRSPSVNGTAFHGRSRIVLSLAQNR